MDQINAMRSFVAVATSDSLTSAARSLGVSISLISRHLAFLEADVGVRLINRTARSNSLTEAGRNHLEFCERILREIEEQKVAVRSVRDSRSGSISVVSPKLIGGDMSQAIVAFVEAQPAITVRYDVGMALATNRIFEFVERGYDIAFFTRDLRDSSIKGRRVAYLPFALCASPGYLDQRGVPQGISDLESHKCLVHRVDSIWNLEYDGKRISHRVISQNLTTNSYVTLRRATLAGVGIAMLPLWSVREDLATGRLVPLLPDYKVPSRPLYALYAPGQDVVPRMRTFVDFIGEWFKQFPSQ